MSVTTHDLYNPPPAPVPYPSPEERPLARTKADWAILTILCAPVIAFAYPFWFVEESIAVGILVGGLLIIGESWFTALGFMQRYPWMGLSGRWKIFAAALVPWIVGLAAAWAFLLGLLAITDRVF